MADGSDVGGCGFFQYVIDDSSVTGGTGGTILKSLATHRHSSGIANEYVLDWVDRLTAAQAISKATPTRRVVSGSKSLKTLDYVVRCGALLLCCQHLRHRFDLLGSPTRIDAAVAVLYQLYPCDS